MIAIVNIYSPLALLRGDLLPLHPPRLLLLPLRLLLLLCRSLLSFPLLPLCPNSPDVLRQLGRHLGQHDHLEGQGVVDRGLQVPELVLLLRLLLVVVVVLLSLLLLLLLGLGGEEPLLEVMGPAHAVLDEGGEDEEDEFGHLKPSVYDTLPF